MDAKSNLTRAIENYFYTLRSWDKNLHWGLSIGRFSIHTWCDILSKSRGLRTRRSMSSHPNDPIHALQIKKSSFHILMPPLSSLLYRSINPAITPPLFTKSRTVGYSHVPTYSYSYPHSDCHASCNWLLIVIVCVLCIWFFYTGLFILPLISNPPITYWFVHLSPLSPSRLLPSLHSIPLLNPLLQVRLSLHTYIHHCNPHLYSCLSHIHHSSSTSPLPHHPTSTNETDQFNNLPPNPIPNTRKSPIARLNQKSKAKIKKIHSKKSTMSLKTLWS